MTFKLLHRRLIVLEVNIASKFVWLGLKEKLTFGGQIA